MAELVRAPIDVPALLKQVTRADCGATALFLGTTRNMHDGRHVVELAYEAYETMALRRLEAIERETVARFDVRACAIVHRLGLVPLTEASVAVAVAAPHRGPAFDACRWAMDELKSNVPIWKKERFAEGGEGWVEGTKLQ